MRRYSKIDKLLNQLDAFRLKQQPTLLPDTQTLTHNTPVGKQETTSKDYSATNPANSIEQETLTDAERNHSIGLMRIDHTGEVCAQGLYDGQAVTAKRPQVKALIKASGEEEIAHLQWCEQRLAELSGHTSVFNPIWYRLSWTMGVLIGLLGDKISLGFIAATEDLVGQHLHQHLQSISRKDKKSIAILSQMLDDELEHANKAIMAGGYMFPIFVKSMMKRMSNMMTRVTYHI